jgi:16S rRNA (guanine527-N7)-methyltransferase
MIDFVKSMNNETVFRAALRRAIKPWNLALSDECINRLARHYLAMVDANAAMNLTRITEPDAAAVLHYADSLAIADWMRSHEPSATSLLDIGTGPGFPSLPIAVACPGCNVVAVESTRKKAEFLSSLASQIRLENLEVVHAHTDHWKPNRRFDIVASRAVAELAECLKSGFRFVAASGWIVNFKTERMTEAELFRADVLSAKLGLATDRPFAYQLAFRDQLLARILDARRRK